jgi:lactoylglutathione lyase
MSLKHVSFICSSAEVMAQFYGVLGAVVEKDWPMPAEGLRRLVLRLGQGRIQFFEVEGEYPSPKAHWAEHIALELEDFDEMLRTLEVNAVKISRPLSRSPSGRRMIFILDPDGRQLELLEANPM